MNFFQKIFLKPDLIDNPEPKQEGLVNNIPPDKKTSSVWLKIFVPVVVVAVVAAGVYYEYYRVPKIAAAFELTADNSDAAGVSPASVFILKSSKNINAVQVKKVVKISPEVDFQVKSLGGNRFQIIPLVKLSGNTIYQFSISEGAAERDYAWAFQVRAPFAAVSTFPRNQATGVPTNSSIEVAFNREGITEPEKSFEISPKVDGRFETHGESVVFLPKSLQGSTVYTVKFKKGLAAQNVEEKLDQDIVFAFETSQSDSSAYNGGNFDFTQNISYFPPNIKPAMPVYGYNVDFSQAQAAIFSFAGENEFIKGYYDSRKWDLGWTYFYRQNGANYDTGKLTQLTSFKPQIIKVDYQTFFELPEALPTGYYLIELKVGENKRQAWVLVNDVSHYYSLTDNNGLVWAYEYGKKLPLQNAQVAYFDQDGVRHELSKTNSDGIAQFTVPEGLKNTPSNSENYGKPKLLEITPNGAQPSLALVSAGWWYGGDSNAQDNFWKYISTDRFTYQLTDNIKFWGVLKGKSQDYRGQKVTVQLRQGYYYYQALMPGFENTDKPLAETQAQITPFDTISGELSYKGVQPGTYQVVVMMNDRVISQSEVEVLAYVKPAYHIVVTPNKQTMYAGDTVDFNVKAVFYDGTPVGAMKLNYTGYNNGQNFNGELLLNQKGEGKVSVTPVYKAANSYYPSSLSLDFTPAQAEEGDINSDNFGVESSVMVFGPHIYLQASQKYQGDDNFSITAKANDIVLNSLADTRSGTANYPDYIGSPKNGLSLSASVEKTEYVQIDDGTYYDPISKTSNPKFTYEERKTNAGNYSGTTSGNGEWTFNLKLPKAERVYYTITISGTDNFGRAISSIVYPYYFRGYDSVYYSGANFDANRLVLGLEFSNQQEKYNQQFSLNQKVDLAANILNGAQYFNGQTLFYRFGHKGIGTAALVKGTAWEDTFTQDFKPGVSYRAVVFGPYGFVESNSLLAGYKQDDAKLQINIQSDKDNYRPGDTAKINVEVKDKNGGTDTGEVNLSVVDEAVFDVLPYYWQQDILQTLYQIDYSEPNSNASDFTPASALQNAGAEGGGCFLSGTKILLPGGKLKNIEEIKVGDLVLTRAGENDAKTMVAAVVQGISSHFVDDYLVLNDSLKVTPEHKLFINGKWLEAGRIKPGDLWQKADGKTEAITSIKKVLAPKTLVYNFNAGTFHTYFAEGVFVHNAEKGGGYRSEFLDTAHFESKALQNGKASFEVKLPDNITSWRATASAFETANIFAGQGVKLLPATLPFFTDAVISETYLSGDQPVVAARAFGVSFNPANTTSFILDIDGLNYHKTQTSNSGVADFVLPPLMTGKYELKLKAKQGGMEDGIIRKFQVVDSYFETKQEKSLAITSGLKGLPVGTDNATNVTFVDAGKGQFYQELIWNSYKGGSRSDQTVASFLAQKMLQQYFGSDQTAKDLELSAYYVPQGGLGLFTYGDSDLEASAKISDLVPDQVYQSQLISYFKSVIKDDKADVHRIAKSLYGLGALHQPVLAKLQLFKDEPDLTLEDKMYVALGLARLGDKESARKIYNDSIRPGLHFEAGQAWLNEKSSKIDPVKFSALAGAVAAVVGQHEDAISVWKYLQEHYPTQDLDALERMIIVREEIGKVSQNEASFTYELNGKKTEVKLAKGQNKVLSFTKDEAEQVLFSNVSGQLMALAVSENYQKPEALPKNAELSVKRSYWVNGKQVDQVLEGGVVTVKLDYTISGQAIDGAYQVVDYLPSGLKSIDNLWQRGLSSSYASCSQKGQPLAVDGNKIYFSAYLPTKCPKFTIEYYARAATKGEFGANPPLIQSLKNYDSLNIGESQKIKVISAGN